MPDPYIFQNENAMEMVGHDHEGIRDHPREMARNLVPAGGHQFGNSAEHWSSVAGADRDEIGARSGVVKARDTDRPAAGFHIFWFTETGIFLTKFRRGEACLALVGSDMSDPYFKSKISFSLVFDTASTLPM